MTKTSYKSFECSCELAGQTAGGIRVVLDFFVEDPGYPGILFFVKKKKKGKE